MASPLAMGGAAARSAPLSVAGAPAQMKVEPWMQALTDADFGECFPVARRRAFTLFCVQCATRVTDCCQAGHKGHNLLLVSDTHTDSCY